MAVFAHLSQIEIDAILSQITFAERDFHILLKVFDQTIIAYGGTIQSIDENVWIRSNEMIFHFFRQLLTIENDRGDVMSTKKSTCFEIFLNGECSLKFETFPSANLLFTLSFYYHNDNTQLI